MTQAQEPDHEVTFTGHLIIEVRAVEIFNIILEACDSVDPIEARVAAKLIVKYFMDAVDKGKPGLDG